LKTAVFIPVRTKSTRLPGKALLEINGKSIIEYLIERVKLARLPNLIVLCTTTNPEDRILKTIAQRNNISYFAGSEKDILDRYLQAAAAYGIDFIINVDGDDIFCDVDYMDKIVEVFLKTGADYLECEGLPLGAAPSGIKVEALQRVCEMKAGNDTETGWDRYFTKDNRFHIEIIKAEGAVNQPDVRMTLDYPEDFQFFKEVITRLYKPGRIFYTREILSLLQEHPEIANLNKGRQEEYWETFRKKAAKVTWRQR
jgi:spore coat polysaccharide biosynthesis protein SpsF